MRNGIEVWADAEKADNFGGDCVNGFKGVVKFEGRFLNTADLIGVFFPIDMEDLIRRKNGQWKCKEGTWHDRAEKCACVSREEKDYQIKRKIAIDNCPNKCKEGWLQGENGMRVCDCVKNIEK